MALDILEKPIAQSVTVPRAPVHGGPLPEQAPQRPEIYKGNVDKMEVLNNGENGNDRAVQFQLKKGTQGLTFVVGMDSDNPKRVLNLETLDKVSEMTDGEYSHTAILQQQDNNLSVLTPDGKDVRLTHEGLEHQPYKVRLNESTIVEILDFDPEKNSIVLHKVSNQPLITLVPLVDVIPPLPVPWWKKRIMDIVVPVAIGSTLLGNIPEQPAPIPPPPIERHIEAQVPEALQCPATKEMTVQPGDSITKLLVDVNGLPRYLTSDGKLNLDLLYKDAACFLVLKGNRQVLGQSDPVIADFLDTVLRNRDTVGPATGPMIYDSLKALNTANGKERFPGANSQLAIIQPGQIFMVPDFRTQAAPVKLAQSSIPAPDLITIAH